MVRLLVFLKLTVPGKKNFLKYNPGHVITLLKSIPQCSRDVSFTKYPLLHFFWSTFSAVLHLIQDPLWGTTRSFPDMSFIWSSLNVQTPFFSLSDLFLVLKDLAAALLLWSFFSSHIFQMSLLFLLLNVFFCHHCSSSWLISLYPWSYYLQFMVTFT